MNNRKLMISVTSSLFVLLMSFVLLFTGTPLSHLSAQNMFTMTAQPLTIEAIVNQLFTQTAEAPQPLAITQTIKAAFDYALTGTAIASSGATTGTIPSTGGLFSQPAFVQTQTAQDLAELHGALDLLIPQWKSSIQANQERHVSSAEAGMPNDNNIKDVVYGKCAADFYVLVVEKGMPTNAGDANGQGYEYTTAASPAECRPAEYPITDWENDGGGWWFVYTRSVQLTLSATATATPTSADQTATDVIPGGTPVSLPGGLQFIDTVIGTGAAAQDGDTLSVKYVGKFTNGTVFDSSDSHGGAPFSFQLGAGQVIEGWDEGLAGMKVGGKRTLIIPPSLAYGTQGVGTIPPNTTLIFDVELVAVS